MSAGEGYECTVTVDDEDSKIIVFDNWKQVSVAEAPALTADVLYRRQVLYVLLTSMSVAQRMERSFVDEWTSFSW